MPRVSERQLILGHLEETAEALLILDLLEDGEHEEIFDLHLVMLAQITSSRFLERPPVYNMRRNIRAIRIEGILGYNDKHFRAEARMSKACFWGLVERLQDDEVFQNNSPNKEQDPVPYQLLLTLFRMGKHGNGSSVAHAASFFELGDGTVVKYTWRCFAAIYRLRSEFLRWPRAEERQEIAARIAHEHHFGSCVGMLDGSLVFMEQRPGVESASDYWCRKHRYAFNIMAICDDTKRIRALVTGWAGAVNDQRVFDHSSFAILTRALQSGLLSAGQYLLADAGYRPMRHVITPYERAAGQFLPRYKETWNYYLSKPRMTIEHTFGLLKSRFSSLKSLAIQVNTERDEARANLWIQCCVILHNILMGETDLDSFWEDKGGMDGMIRTLDTLRASNERDRMRYEEMTGASIEEVGYQLDETDLVRDDTVLELLRAAAEQRDYRPYLEDG